LLMASLMTGCGKHGKAAPSGGSDIPPSKVSLKRNVELARVEQRPLVYYVETVGRIEAEGETGIAAGVTGIVDEVLFREGQQVDRNTILVKVDQRRYKAAADVTRANEKRAERNVKLKKDLANRAQFGRGGVSEQDKTQTLLDFQLAEAELESARAARALAEHYLDRSQVRAPYTGQMNQRMVTPGTYLEEKTLIGTMADLGRLRLVGWAPESDAPMVRRLMQQQEARLKAVRLTLPLGGWLAASTPWTGLVAHQLVQQDAVPSGFDPEFIAQPFPQRMFRARLFFMCSVASPGTHMFECKAEIDRRGLDGELSPGDMARIRFPIKTNPKATIIPEESVRATERGFVVFEPVRRVGRNGETEWIARARTVDRGASSEGWVEVREG